MHFLPPKTHPQTYLDSTGRIGRCFADYLVTQERCTAGRDNHSDMAKTWSVSPAAMAGLRFTQRPSSSREVSVRTGQQKL